MGKLVPEIWHFSWMTVKGVCFDGNRSAETTIDYNSIESFKNDIVSGKYTGKCLRIHPMKVIIFANFSPN